MQAARNAYTIREGSVEEKTELQQSYSHQTSDDPPDVQRENALTSQKKRKQCTLQRPDDRRDTGRPTHYSARTTDRYRKSDDTCPEKKRQKFDALRTSGPPGATGRPTAVGRPTLPARRPTGFHPCIPFPLTSSWLRL